MLPASLTRIASPPPSSARRLTAIMALLAMAAFAALPWADIQLVQSEPWPELQRLFSGLLLPEWHEPHVLLHALGQTLAFAVLAVALSVPLGMLLALLFQWRLIRWFCAAIRSVHELFWGLLLMQVFGLSATTGVLAILLPYSGVFAKVFAETLALQDATPSFSLSMPAPKSIFQSLAQRLVLLCYTRIPQALPALLSYIRYRFECALRSSAILGFIGLPTLGFHLETLFKQGVYSQAGALLWAFLILIGTMRYWLRPRLIPIYIVASWWLLPETIGFSNSGYFWQFITQDIWPTPLREGDWHGTSAWLLRMWQEQAWPGLVQTVLLTQMALFLTLLVTLVVYPLASRAIVGSNASKAGQLLLLIMRSTPEMMLAFIFLLLFGPSGLPAVLALAIHNGGLIGFLVANNSNARTPSPTDRLDNPDGILRYLYLETPTQLPSLLAWLFYRWEVMLRESAIMGILGITTLGFYIDSAFEEIRYDRAFFLILVTVALTVLIDGCSRWLRNKASVEGIN